MEDNNIASWKCERCCFFCMTCPAEKPIEKHNLKCEVRIAEEQRLAQAEQLKEEEIAQAKAILAKYNIEICDF